MAIGNSGGSQPLRPTLTNATFSGNSAVIQGGAIYNTGDNDLAIEPAMDNSILWWNSAAAGASIYNSADPGAVTIRNSTVQNGANSIGGNQATYDASNLDSDPLFTHPVDPATAPTTRGSLRLQAGSPAIDKGGYQHLAP